MKASDYFHAPAPLLPLNIE